MAVTFPTGTADLIPTRTSVLLCDNGTQGGDVTIAQVLRLIVLDDVLPRLMEANDVIEEVGATATTYQVQAADKNKTKLFLSTAACSVLLPAGLPLGFFVDWIQWGTGQLTFASVGGASQTILSTAGLKSNGAASSGVLRLVRSNTWLLTGETVA